MLPSHSLEGIRQAMLTVNTLASTMHADEWNRLRPDAEEVVMEPRHSVDDHRSSIEIDTNNIVHETVNSNIHTRINDVYPNSLRDGRVYYLGQWIDVKDTVVRIFTHVHIC